MKTLFIRGVSTVIAAPFGLRNAYCGRLRCCRAVFQKIKPVHQNRCLLLFRNRYCRLRYQHDPSLKSIATKEKS